MRLLSAATLLLLSILPSFAQMTLSQKQDDFRQLVALYDKDYAFYEWKRDAIGFDLLNIRPWLDRLAATTDDLGYYEIAAQYVASLKDGHDTYLNPSDFVADLRFRVDLYDGKALVDAIDRTALPARGFNIQIGDELVSLDGKTPEDYITDFSKYYQDGSARSTRRDAVDFSSIRPQSINPRAAIVGDTADVVLRGSDGVLKNLTIKWVKSGTPFTSIGPVPNPYLKPATPLLEKGETEAARRVKPHPVNVGPAADGEPVTSSEQQKFYRTLTKRFQLMLKPESFNGLGSITPIYRRGLPATFKQRLGTRSSDFFFSGTYTSGNSTVGLIRIADFCPDNCVGDFTTIDAAVAQFQKEIVFLKANSDALVVDVTRNPGGFGFYGLQLLDRLTDKPYTHAGMNVRPQYADIVSINQLLDSGAQSGLEQWQLNLLTAYRDEIRRAYQENRGMTGPLPIDLGLSVDPADPSFLSFTHPAVLDSTGKPVGYNKPVLCLADDASFSAAELFSGAFQDMNRGPVFGYVTGGLGGGRMDTTTGIYSEAFTSVTVQRLLRSKPIASPDYPSAPYIENIGIRPDITLDYMTADNLTTGGKAFVDGFTQAVLALLAPK